MTLPAYKDPQLTAYFADNATLYFADLEGLQDQLVDAVLDLCEDEDETVGRPRLDMYEMMVMGHTKPLTIR